MQVYKILEGVVNAATDHATDKQILRFISFLFTKEGTVATYVLDDTTYSSFVPHNGNKFEWIHIVDRS